MKKVVFIFFMLIVSAVLSAQAMPNETISVNFDKISIGSALKWFAKLNQMNLMVSVSVKGDVSLHLEKVSWQEAFRAMLISQGLADLKEGSVIYVAPMEEIARRKQQLKLASSEAMLTSQLIRLNYAKAADIAKLLQNKDQGILSKQGSVFFDNRTNSLILKDTPSQVKTVKALINRLDVSVKQVAIEARIVNIDDDYEKELGIKFGVTAGRHLSGSLEGANEISSHQSIASVNPDHRLNVDLPVAVQGAGRIGLALFQLTRGTLIDLELSALESEGRAEIISTPKVITANQQPAMIEAGEEIPYQAQASIQGATITSFKKAMLRLRVTPHITPNGKIILYLQVNQDKRSSNEIQGVPTIDTRQIITQVLVNNGQTVVLGGIYEQTRINGVDRVPFFSDLPGIGVLFRHKKVVNDRRELLIFVTPRIIN